MDIRTIMEAGKVVRLHTVDCHVRQNLAEHQWGVAALVAFIYDGLPPNYLLLKAMFHDVGELFTGDMPAHVKWANPALSKALDMVSVEAECNMGVRYSVDEAEKFILKAADKLELMWFCVAQLRLGNKNLIIVYDRLDEWFNGYPEEIERRIQPQVDRIDLLHDIVTKEWYDAREL